MDRDDSVTYDPSQDVDPTNAQLESIDESMKSFEAVDKSELNVNKEDIEPWKAKSEIPVRKGDVVETDIFISDEAERQQSSPEDSKEA